MSDDSRHNNQLVARLRHCALAARANAEICGEAADVIEALFADATRLDWLADKNQHIGNVQLPIACVEANLSSLRGAIDAAMRLEPNAQAVRKTGQHEASHD